MITEATETEYDLFLERKRISAPACGFDVPADDLNPMLFEWQRRAVAWALKRGRAALFEDCGLGKTFQQLECADVISRRQDAPSLILAPLGVTRQTAREGEKFTIPVTVCRAAADIQSGVNITNYERLQDFDPSKLSSITLDESSILKGDGPLRKSIVEFAECIPYRLACTATPAPNDVQEIINHAEFLGIRRGPEILAEFFMQDGNTTHKWKLKEHARQAFWQWLASWALAMRRPSDIGGSDEGFILPPIQYIHLNVAAPTPTTKLFQDEARGIQEQRRVRKETLTERVQATAEVVNASSEPFIVWCELNAESEALAKAIPDAIEVKGSLKDDVKSERLQAFSEGKHRVIVLKSSYGFGLNWQHCWNQMNVGQGNSFERIYQNVRRSYRFGQEKEVRVTIVTSDADGEIIRNVQRKERDHNEMMDQLVRETKALTGIEGAAREDMHYEETTRKGEGWELHLGDCIEGVRKVPDNSVGLWVYSPPFPSMYSYTNSPRDIGNCRGIDEMMEHYRHLIPELLRTTLPGRSCCVHLCQGISFKSHDGHCGLKDFRGKVIEAHEAAGWIYYGEVVIAKNPQLKAIRTKDRGLLFKTLANDSSLMHMALNDYVLQFVKPGQNAVPIRAGVSEKYGNHGGWITQEEWINWACGTWTDIDEFDVIQNYREGRDSEDEKHLCPLQRGVIARCVKLWSNPGDLVGTPFAGIGSELDQAIRHKRRALGFELKRSYFEVACRNAARAEMDGKQKTLFDDLAGDE